MAMTGWDDDQDLSDEEGSAGGEDEYGNGVDDDDFEDRIRRDGVYGSVSSRPSKAVASPPSPTTRLDQSIPYEQRWQVDAERANDVQPVCSVLNPSLHR